MSTDWQKRVRELFDSALDQPAEVRRQFLSAACEGDRQLEDTVGRLLSAHERSVGILDTPIRVRGEEPTVHHEDGSYIGSYKIIREIGSGGMGIVYQAVRADEVFQRVCAVKVIRAELSSPRLLQQFRQERQVLAQLDHVNIARIVDGGSTPEGLPYFVMDYVDGPSIFTYCGQHRLSTRARLALFQQVCAAVQYLHLNGVIHGDLKPPNMLVGNDGGVRLVDFGIASALSAHQADGDSLPLMTPGYASPEQMAGKPLSPASDVFSLGVVLYELLTGARPFNLAGCSRSEALACVQNVVPLSAAASGNASQPGQGDGFVEVTRELDSIVLRAMHYDPEQRYQSAAELSAEISCYLQGRPVRAHKKSLLYAGRKFLARRRAEVSAVIVILALLATASWEGVKIRERDIAARVHQSDVQDLQSKLDKEQRERERVQEELAKLIAAEQGRQAAHHGARPLQDSELRVLQLRQSDLQERQLQDFRNLAEAYRTSFSESVRLWPGMTPARRKLLQQAQDYLRQATPVAAHDPKAREELARAWMYLANIQGNPQTPNLHDRAGAISSIKQASDLLDQTPGASPQLRQQVQLAAQQIEAAR